MSYVITILGLGALIAIHEFGHLVVARLMGMRVETYSIGFGPKLFGFTRGETEYRLSAVPLGGYCKIAGFTPDEDGGQGDPNDPRNYLNKAAWRRFLVIAAGPGVNYLAAFAILLGLYVSVGGRDFSVLRVEVMPDGAAQAGGMLTGDLITAVDGVPVKELVQVSGELGKPGPEVRVIEVERAGAKVPLQIKPKGGRIGVMQSGATLVLPFGQAISRALSDVWTLNVQTIQLIGALFQGKGGASLSGPVGIVQQASQAVQRGLSVFGGVLAQLSVSLAVFNFLPIPALDGGRLVFLAYEITTGRRPNQKLETTLHVIGFLALIALLVGVTVFGDLQLGKKVMQLLGK